MVRTIIIVPVIVLLIVLNDNVSQRFHLHFPTLASCLICLGEASHDGVPKNKKLLGPTEQQLYGSSWETKH